MHHLFDWTLAPEPLQQRPGQLLHRHRRTDPAPCRFPELRRRKVLRPPLAPPLDRPPVHAEPRVQLRRSARRHAMPHRCHDHHDRAEVELAPQKPYRRRREPLAAAVPRAAKAQPFVVALRQRRRACSWLPWWKVCGVQGLAAHQAAPTPRLRGDLVVDVKQKLVERGVCEQAGVQGTSPWLS